MKKMLISAAIAAATFSTASYAESDFYLGAGIGQASVDYEAQAGVQINDDSDTSWKIFGGYNINENFAVELAYQDLGENEATVSGTNVKLDADALSLALVGKMPLANKFSAMGKLGYARVDAEAVANGAKVSADDSDFLYGVGLTYQVAEQAEVRLEWERMNFTDEIDTWTLGFSYNF